MSSSKKIPIRTNLYLWFLTGRSDDFVNASLNVNINYSVKETPPEVRHVRSLLQLGRTDSDFYVLSILGASKISTSLLRDMPPELDAVFVRGLLNLPAVSCTAALLPLTDATWPYFDGRRAGKDGFTTITFQAVDATTSLIVTDQGGSEETTHATVNQDGGTVKVQFDKGEEYGVFSSFQTATWDPGDQIVLTIPQTKFPFVDYAAKIDKDRVALKLMNSEGTLQAYGETSNPAIKVGMLGLAVIRRMLRLVNDEQAGFEVTITDDDSGIEPLPPIYEIDPAPVESLDAPVADDDSPVGFDA